MSSFFKGIFSVFEFYVIILIVQINLNFPRNVLVESETETNDFQFKDCPQMQRGYFSLSKTIIFF